MGLFPDDLALLEEQDIVAEMADEFAIVAADDDRGALIADRLEQGDDLEGELRR